MEGYNRWIIERDFACVGQVLRRTAADREVPFRMGEAPRQTISQYIATQCQQHRLTVLGDLLQRPGSD